MPTTRIETRGNSGARRISRRDVLRGIGAAGAGLAVASGGWRGSARATSAPPTTPDSFQPVPAVIGQSEAMAFVPATGHTVSGIFLDYWRANGAASVYGNPISEPFIAGNGYESQAFEAGIFQFRPEYLHTVEPVVRLMSIGWAAVEFAGISSAPLDPGSHTVARILEAGGLFDDTTGHTISGEILSWYRFNEGAYYLGRPLTEPLADDSGAIQYFEGGAVRLGPDGARLEPVAALLAPRFGIDTTPVDQGDLPFFDELMFWITDLADLRGDPYSPGAKWIEIGITEQRLWAYHGYTLIASSLISSGITPNDTNLGMFRVRLKYPEQDMQGFTNETGEVIGFGDAPAGAIPYEVTGVPHVMYFNLDAEAVHGAYWHNSFGQKMSHGCVNLPLSFAEWLFGWAPLGTGVWIRE